MSWIQLVISDVTLYLDPQQPIAVNITTRRGMWRIPATVWDGQPRVVELQVDDDDCSLVHVQSEGGNWVAGDCFLPLMSACQSLQSLQLVDICGSPVGDLLVRMSSPEGQGLGTSSDPADAAIFDAPGDKDPADVTGDLSPSSCGQGRETQMKDELLAALEKHRVVIVTGPTGCGKSSTVPLWVLESSRSCRMYCCQPTRIGAIGLAEYLQQTVGPDCASKVGLWVSLRVDNPQAALVYCTYGVVLAMLRTLADTLTHLVLDEVHDMCLDCELLMAVMRERLAHTKVKIIIMSATMDTSAYQRYFQEVGVTSAVVKLVAPRTFPVETVPLDVVHARLRGSGFGAAMPPLKEVLQRGPAQRISLVVCLLLFLHAQEPRCRSILVFVAGLADIDQLERRACGAAGLLDVDVIRMHSSEPPEKLRLAFDPPPPNTRRILLATNIAESSITIPHCDIVIDGCRCKVRSAVPRSEYAAVEERYVSWQSALQRQGRTGRVGQGTVYRMLTDLEFERHVRGSSKVSELRAQPLVEAVLTLRRLGLDADATLRRCLTWAQADGRPYPGLDHMLALAWATLGRCGAVRGPSRALSKRGHILARLPVGYELALTVVHGLAFGLPREACAAAAVGKRYPFAEGRGTAAGAYRSKRQYSPHFDSDIIAGVNALRAFMQNPERPEEEWAAEGLSRDHLQLCQELYEECLRCLASHMRTLHHQSVQLAPPHLPDLQTELLLLFCTVGSGVPCFTVPRQTAHSPSDAGSVAVTGIPAGRSVQDVADHLRRELRTPCVPVTAVASGRAVVSFPEDDDGPLRALKLPKGGGTVGDPPFRDLLGGPPFQYDLLPLPDDPTRKPAVIPNAHSLAYPVRAVDEDAPPLIVAQEVVLQERYIEVRAPLTLVPAAMAPLALAVWHPRWAPYWELGPAGHRLPSRTEFRSDPARAQVTACWTVTTEDGPVELLGEGLTHQEAVLSAFDAATRHEALRRLLRPAPDAALRLREYVTGYLAGTADEEALERLFEQVEPLPLNHVTARALLLSQLSDLHAVDASASPHPGPLGEQDPVLASAPASASPTPSGPRPLRRPAAPSAADSPATVAGGPPLSPPASPTAPATAADFSVLLALHERGRNAAGGLHRPEALVLPPFKSTTARLERLLGVYQHSGPAPKPYRSFPPVVSKLVLVYLSSIS